MIRESLASKRVLLTGVTGFLGTALFERILTDVPVGGIDVVIRGDAEQRLSWLLAGSAFGPARQRLGSDRFDELVKEKVRPISADLSVEAPDVGSDVDLVIHSAATVQFDPPIDDAFAINLHGSTRLLGAAEGRPFIHISTAYVAGKTKGIQDEELLHREIDWRAEASSAERMRDQVEDESRRPEVLEKLEAEAASEMGRAGPRSTAQRAEELRRKWVDDRLVRAGRARARSLGWPEVYSFTKALTEIALDDLAGDGSLTIVRPSIIESALARPVPGWIEGFRMMDPVILGFARGNLPEFLGSPDIVVDVIPVDLVVNCILAVAAQPPEKRAVYHACSGHRNPMTLRQIYELTRDYFVDQPLPEPRGFYKLPEWTFPGRKAVEKRIQQADRLLGTAERLVRKIPRSPLARESARRVDRFRRRLDFAKRMADLYGPYAEVEVIYTDHRAREVWESLPEEDRADFPFDPTAFTWREFMHDVHLPMLTAPLRWVAPRRADAKVKITPNGDGLVLAVFDVEGTIVGSNVVEAYLWLRLSELAGADRLKQTAALARKLPRFLSAERRDRGDFLRRFYRLYEGVDVSEARSLASESMEGLILRRLAPAAVRRIRAHRAAGHRIVFITGSLDFIVEPIRALADEVVTARLQEIDGRFTGDLEKAPLVGEARSSWLSEYAQGVGADLQSCFAYADSISDLPLLETVGNPVAVNADVSLSRIARARGWANEEWPADPGSPKVMFPEANGPRSAQSARSHEPKPAVRTR
jgi:fatty acyl-CoA reductase